MSAAERAERIALAVLTGEVTMADARGDLALANHEAEVSRQADSLRRHRAGESVMSWPSVAPWSGF